MALEDLLASAGFLEEELLGQWPRFQYPNRYCVYDVSENALVQAFPADRPDSWFMAVLNYSKSTLDYGSNPRPPIGVVDVMRKYCFTGVRLWVKREGEFWTGHPWHKAAAWKDVFGIMPGTRNMEDAGVPGTTQFLTVYPFCEPSLLNGNITPVGSNGLALRASILLAPKVEPVTESPYSRKIEI